MKEELNPRAELDKSENEKLSNGGAPVLSVVAKNSVANLTKMAALSITVFVLPPILVRVLDKPAYATWMLILQIGTYVALVDGSMQSAISRFVARSRSLSDDRYMGEMISSASALMLSAALITAAFTTIGSWQLGHLFPGIPSSIGPDARRALLIFGISLSVSLPFSALAGAFLGLQMNAVNAVAGSVGRILGAVGATFAAYRHQSLSAMALWTAFGYLFQSFLYVFAWKRLATSGLIRWANVTRAAVREFATFCFAIFAAQWGGILISGLDMPIVAAFDFHSAAYYAMAATVSTMVTVPQAAVVNTLIPIAAGISATSNPARLGSFLVKTTRYSTAILCLIVSPLLLGMSPFLRIWVGADYAGHAFTIATLLVVAQFIRLTLLPYAAIGFAAGQQHRMLLSPVGEGVVNLACSLVGVRYLGAVGVALGTLVGAFAGVLLHFAISMPRTDEMRFNRLELLITGILRPTACCLPGFFVVLSLANLKPSSLALVALICAGEVLAFLLLWKFNFNPHERNEIVELVRRTARRLRIGRPVPTVTT